MGFRIQKQKKGPDRASDTVRRALGTRSIVLIGLMGAGKTSIGHRVANRLDLPFTDADAEIEAAAGMSVSDFFAEHGEAAFREGERKVIQRLLNGGPQVLATGGGAYMDPATRENIRNAGVSIWLKADLNTLMERVSRRHTRPLLQTDNPRAVMQKLLDERYPVYVQADVTVISRDAPHELVVNDILSGLCENLSEKN